MIPSNEIHKKQKWTAMMHSGTRHKKKKIYFTFHRQLFCHCLQLLQEPLTVSEIGKNEKLLVSANKYKAAEANILNKTKAMVDLQ